MFHHCTTVLRKNQNMAQLVLLWRGSRKSKAMAVAEEKDQKASEDEKEIDNGLVLLLRLALYSLHFAISNDPENSKWELLQLDIFYGQPPQIFGNFPIILIWCRRMSLVFQMGAILHLILFSILCCWKLKISLWFSVTPPRSSSCFCCCYTEE